MVELGDLARKPQGLFLFEQLKVASVSALLKRNQVFDPSVDRAPVGQGSPQPTLIHVGHSAAQRLLLYALLSLPLGAQEKDRTSLGHVITDDIVRLVQGPQGLLKIDDVNPIALGKDVRLHLGVPALGAMTKVDSCLQELFHCNDSHGYYLLDVFRSPSSSRQRT